MQAVVKESPGRGLALKEVDPPRVGPNDVLIRVGATTICGSDLHIWKWNEWAEGRMREHLPLVIGHEMSGEVVERGSEVADTPVGAFVSVETHFWCGKCLPCRMGNPHVCRNLRILGVDRHGSYAEYVSVPSQNVWVNDPALSPEIASIQEPFGNAVDTVLSEDIAAKTVLVTGCGPIGCMGVAVAKACGAALVIATDVHEGRLELARTMGADIVLNAKDPGTDRRVLDATDQEGVEVFLEFSGAQAALEQGLRLTVPGGRVSLLGLPEHPVTLDLNDTIIFKALRVYGITGRRIFATWHKASGLLKSGRVDLRPLITHRFPLAEFEEGMRLMDTGACGKVALFPRS